MAYFTKPIDTKSISLEQIISRTVVNNDCLEWRIGPDKNGYGRISINKNRYKTSRVVCQLVYGLPKSNQQALHSCDNPPCVNPEHLRWGTIKENHQDRSTRNRSVDQIKSIARYSDAEVYEIRKMLAEGIDTSIIKSKFGLNKSTFHNIRRNKTWKHITLSD